MELCSISMTQSQNYAMAHLHCHEFYEMYFQVAGKRQYFCENKYYALKRNTLIVTEPNLLHKYEGGPYERILIGIPLETLSPAQNKFLAQLSKKRVIEFLDKDMEGIRKTLDELLEIHANLINDGTLRFSLTLGELFQKIFKAKSQEITPTHILDHNAPNKHLNPLILKVMDYVRLHYNEHITYTQLCSAFNLSKTWLCKSFMQTNGITIFDYKLIIQLNEAKRLLRTSNYSISKIAQVLGFSSANYFTKVFKKEFSLTPLAYRRRYTEKHSSILP